MKLTTAQLKRIIREEANAARLPLGTKNETTKITVSQLRRIIREELIRAKNPSNLHELFGFGEKPYYQLHVVYKLNSNDLFGNAGGRADKYEGG